MIEIIGTNIISPLGFSTAENFENVKRGTSGVKRCEAGTFDMPEEFMAALIDKERLRKFFAEQAAENSATPPYTDLEKAAILSVMDANKQAKINLTDKKTIFIISTTKGNVDLLGKTQEGGQTQPSVFLWNTAKKIADFFHNPNTPLVVSNACISGAAAQVAALRALRSGRYENAVVAGVDFLSKFIISGFQSFKALAPDLCRPFDKNRSGLNLGEAAATMIFQKQSAANSNSVVLAAGCVRNDANHISAPSRTGEGCLRALKNILQNIDKQEIAFINAHGTATAYNDAMESAAITRAGLAAIPVNSLKAHFGHTLGTAGVLESIISVQALMEKTVLKSLNYSEQSFDNQINVATEHRMSDKKYFVKLLSGFGGVNAALLFAAVK